MRIKIASGLGLALLAGCTAGHAAPGPVPMTAFAQPAPALMLEGVPPAAATSVRASAGASGARQNDGVRVWLDGNRDLIHAGQRVRVNLRTDRDAYVAVFHIDTNGDLDVLYPRSEYDDGWVDRGRTLRLGTRGTSGYLWSRGGPGIGYIFAVALDEPLELWRLRDWYRPRQAGWNPDRTIWGDPFYAMDEIVRTVVPEWALGYESVDHYTYHMGRRYTHPRYACYDGYGDWYYGRAIYWSSCDRVRIILVGRPYYYDTYRWRGSRRVYYERYYTPVARTSRPLHGYKERTDQHAPAARAAERRPEPAARPAGGAASAGRAARPDAGGASTAARPDRAGDAARPGGAREEAGGARARPATPTDRGSYTPPPREEARPAQREAPPQRESTPRREAPPQRESTPRREAPPQREEARPAERQAPPQPEATPRRESPPQRESAPRREAPPQREAAPSRERAPSRESAPRSQPRSRPPEEEARTAMLVQQDQQQQDRPVETSRERPTFQRRGSEQPRAAQPRRDEQPRREAQPQRERPQQDSGGSRSRPSEPAARPPEG